MPRRDRMDAAITIRIDKETRDAFNEEAYNHGTPASVLRELVMAFIEHRLVVHPPANPKGSLYAPRNLD